MWAFQRPVHSIRNRFGKALQACTLKVGQQYLVGQMKISLLCASLYSFNSPLLRGIHVFNTLSKFVRNYLELSFQSNPVHFHSHPGESLGCFVSSPTLGIAFCFLVILKECMLLSHCDCISCSMVINDIKHIFMF